jgi:hypothetical protein
MLMRFGVFFLLAVVAAARRAGPIAQAKSEVTEPKLPVVEKMPCLAKGRAHWAIRSGSPIYSSWQSRRAQIGRLTAGQTVDVIAGINITREPDRIVVTRAKPDIGLKPGDIILRYEIFGEGEANIWANGACHKGYSLGTTTETDGTGCGAKNACDSKVVANGVKEQWVQVRTASGLTGWVLASKVTHGVFWDSGVFGQLCAG